MALEPTIDPSEVGIDPARLARIDEVTHAYVDDGRFPFVQLLVSRRGEIVHHDVYGFADRDGDRPIRDDAIVRVYSMTKPVPSVALMMLYEQGRVLLEDPVSSRGCSASTAGAAPRRRLSGSTRPKSCTSCSSPSSSRRPPTHPPRAAGHHLPGDHRVRRYRRVPA